MPVVEHFSPQILSFPEVMTTGQNASVDIHFVRHGEKNKKGQLRRSAVRTAERFGEQLATEHPEGLVSIYSGNMQRVKQTAAAIARGVTSVTSIEPGVEEWDLLSHATFLLDREKSEYFHEVNKSLHNAFKPYIIGNGRRLHRAEARNIHRWIDSDRTALDSGTAAPWEIAKNVTAIVDACLDKMTDLPNGTHMDYVLVTHEHVVAAVVRYLLLAMHNGRNQTGEEIFDDVERILYNEDVTLHIQEKGYGEKMLSATFRGQTYAIQIDQSSDSPRYREFGRAA